METLFALRLADLQTFVAVARHRSLARTAELDGRDPIAIRASIAHVEDAIGATLFEGKDHDLDLTPKAVRLLPIVTDILDRAGQIEADEAPGGSRTRLTLSSPTFIAEVLFPHLVRSSSLRGTSLRGLSVPPVLMSQYAEQRIIDAALSVGAELDLPMGWSSIQVGEVRYGLFASPELVRALGPEPSVETIRRHRFVAPVYVSRAGDLVPGDDRCPLGRNERIVGHEVENMTLACRVAAESDLLVYGPALAAAPFVTSRVLAEVPLPVAGWSQSDAVFLACDAASVRPNVQDALSSAIRTVLGGARHSGIVQLDTFIKHAAHKLG